MTWPFRSLIFFSSMALIGVSTTSALPQRLEDYSETIDGHSIPMVGTSGGTFRVTAYLPTEFSEFGVRKWPVTVSPFWIGKYEVRRSDYRSFLVAWSDTPVAPEAKRAHRTMKYNSELHGPTAGGGSIREYAADYPVVGIHQWNAKRYCHWLSMRTGRFYRLPTEAEWEFACRAGNDAGRYPWGDSSEQLAKYAVTAPERGTSLQIVGTKEPNAWGIYDMIGNAEEWVADGFETIRDDGRINPITWPASRHLSQDPQKIWDEFKAKKEHFCDGWGVAKGGSHEYRRCQEPICFTVAARTNPSILSNFEDPVYSENPKYSTYSQDTWHDLMDPFSETVGFRLARPLKIPDRTRQLWHWGIYFDHDQWIDLTLEPTPDEEESDRP
jgi:formylglycine-generating enzyme required for sulfatase activity